MAADITAGIKAIEDRYGLVIFRMGLTHLVDVGVRHLTAQNVDAALKQIKEDGAAEKAQGVISLMTPEFKAAIVRCAADLAAFSIWELFTYIKHHVVVE